DILRG
uniref:Yamamarin n=1 Tax=Antheraea yamamai TaxID=7121 RepID=PENT_ANTYA